MKWTTILDDILVLLIEIMRKVYLANQQAKLVAKMKW